MNEEEDILEELVVKIDTLGSLLCDLSISIHASKVNRVIDRVDPEGDLSVKIEQLIDSLNERFNK